MTKTEALQKLHAVVPTLDPWYKNPVLTWEQAYKTILGCIENQDTEWLADWMQKRVNEVLKNKKIKLCPHCGGSL